MVWKHVESMRHTTRPCLCRSSPFFWAFAEGLIRDRDMASAIFAFTDSIPGAYIGRAVQDIDMETGSLVSRVNMTVFPAISGTVVTTSTITGVSEGSGNNTGSEVQMQQPDHSSCQLLYRIWNGLRSHRPRHPCGQQHLFTSAG